jgi:hypothetical protein
MKQRIILPALKQMDLSMVDAPPQTPMDGRRSRQVSSLRRRYAAIPPISSEELPAFDTGFFPTQTLTKPLPISQPTSPRLAPETKPTASQYTFVEASGLTQRLFGGE